MLVTPGHARHHICIRDCATDGIFTGDAFGLAYREFDEPAGQGAADEAVRRFVFPTASPSQFDPAAMRRSIDLLMGLLPPVLYPTHFGRIRPDLQVVTRPRRLIDAHVAIALRERDGGTDREARIRAGLARLLFHELREFGSTVPQERALDVMAADLDLNAQGLEYWLQTAVEVCAAEPTP